MLQELANQALDGFLILPFTILLWLSVLCLFQHGQLVVFQHLLGSRLLRPLVLSFVVELLVKQGLVQNNLLCALVFI